jgi:GT2 family glycosyltransferase
MHGISPIAEAPRAQSDGKFLRVDGSVFLIRGASYGTFAPRQDAHQFPELAQVRRDFGLMAAAGINTVRTYTVPPPDVLDAAAERGLRVMAGLAWPDHVAFVDDRRLRRAIIRDIGAQARAVARHPALLLLAVGNEIPPSVVRWHGQRAVESFIRAAFAEARHAAPDVPLTYVNYPPTEYLELPFLDVCAFNLYLHDESAMRAYVARLQHIAADRPLLLTECGADSQRLGETRQAALAAMQVRVAFGEGAAGAIVFSWTDEWWRGGAPVIDWSFGLVDRDRRPKLVCRAVGDVFAAAPFAPSERHHWPSVSVIVCAYNAAATIDDCLDALEKLEYPTVELIVVDDGSTDDTAARARAHPSVRLIEIDNGGLSAARNVGLRAASGEIVAYVDSDVRVDESWLTYLVQPFLTSDAVAVGGPNRVPRDDPWFAHCVARSPGGPSHVLIDDRLADHVPGCNLAIRRTALLSIGGFDPIFLRAGDDVDVCWRLQSMGGRIAFSAAALVWHHHRTNVAAYWRQQVGYGEGEAWLRLRHRHRFSGSTVLWHGRIYSSLPFVQSLTVRQVHSGVWGTAAFPTVYHTGARPLQAFPHTPGWQIGSALLLLCGLIAYAATGQTASLFAIAMGALGFGITGLKCATYAYSSDISRIPPLPRGGFVASQLLYRATIAWLHLIQPLARLYGYARGRLRTPVTVVPRAVAPEVVPARNGPRRRTDYTVLLGRPARCAFWSEIWTASDILLLRIMERLRIAGVGSGVHVDDGWRSDRDISVALGSWCWAHVRTLVEDHGTGRCLWRVRMVVRPRLGGIALIVLLSAAVLMADMAGSVAITLLAAGCALLAVAAVARDLVRDLGRILDVITAVADDHGMLAMTATLKRQRVRAALSRWRGLPAQGG